MILEKHRIAVQQRDDKVVLAIGNSEITMDYATALQLSQWLRYRGKEAKRFAGDISQHWSIIATLGDAEQHDKQGWR